MYKFEEGFSEKVRRKIRPRILREEGKKKGIRLRKKQGQNWRGGGRRERRAEEEGQEL